VDNNDFFRDRDLLRANPALTTLHSQRFWFLFFTASLVALLGLRFVVYALFSDSGSSSSNSIIYAYLCMLILYVFLVILSFLQERYWRRIEKLRFAAVKGDRSLLADEQPIPDTLALSLPATIRLRPSKWLILQMLGWTVVVVLIIIGAFHLFGSNFATFTPANFQAFAAFVALIVALLWGLFVLFILVYKRLEIKIMAQGLSVNHFGSHHTIKWDEVRLFARYSTFSDPRRKRIITYELSSTTNIVYLSWIQSKSFPATIEPAIRLEEYHRRMRALLSLIAAKTGRPLYDLGGNRG
jgi:hypothetical protein